MEVRELADLDMVLRGYAPATLAQEVDVGLTGLAPLVVLIDLAFTKPDILAQLIEHQKAMIGLELSVDHMIAFLQRAHNTILAIESAAAQYQATLDEEKADVPET